MMQIADRTAYVAVYDRLKRSNTVPNMIKWNVLHFQLFKVYYASIHIEAHHIPIVSPSDCPVRR